MICVPGRRNCSASSTVGKSFGTSQVRHCRSWAPLLPPCRSWGPLLPPSMPPATGISTIPAGERAPSPGIIRSSTRHQSIRCIARPSLLLRRIGGGLAWRSVKMRSGLHLPLEDAASPLLFLPHGSAKFRSSASIPPLPQRPQRRGPWANFVGPLHQDDSSSVTSKQPADEASLRTDEASDFRFAERGCTEPAAGPLGKKPGRERLDPPQPDHSPKAKATRPPKCLGKEAHILQKSITIVGK